MGRAPCCEKVGLKRGRWTAEEDEILVKYIQANGEGSWRSLPKNAGILLLLLVNTIIRLCLFWGGPLFYIILSLINFQFDKIIYVAIYTYY